MYLSADKRKESLMTQIEDGVLDVSFIFHSIVSST